MNLHTTVKCLGKHVIQTNPSKSDERLFPERESGGGGGGGRERDRDRAVYSFLFLCLFISLRDRDSNLLCLQRTNKYSRLLTGLSS